MRHFPLFLLGGLLAAAPAAAQEPCFTRYYGPSVGETKELEPGHMVGGTLIEIGGGGASLLGGSELIFKGRTGERTFAFEHQNEQKTWSVARGTSRPEEKNDSQDLSVYWEGPDAPIRLKGYRFRLLVNEGVVSLIMLEHPKAGPCANESATPASNAAVDADDAQHIMNALDLNAEELAGSNFNPRYPVIQGCTPDAQSVLTCNGQYPTNSPTLCRAAASPQIIGMKIARKNTGQSPPMSLTIRCQGPQVLISYSPDGTLNVTETDSTGRTIFQKSFRY